MDISNVPFAALLGRIDSVDYHTSEASPQARRPFTKGGTTQQHSFSQIVMPCSPFTALIVFKRTAVREWLVPIWHLQNSIC